MAYETRAFGTKINNANERRAFAPLNIQNNNNHVGAKSFKPTLSDLHPSCFENQENRIAIQNHGLKNAFYQKTSSNADACLKKNSSFQIYDEGIFSQETTVSNVSNDEEKILDDNIEAVKKELHSFLIDSQEKSQLSDISEKENISVDDSFMVVDSKDASTDSVLDHSQISYAQHNCDFDKFAEYSESILAYMLEKERKFMPDPFYMNNQVNINIKMRSILVDWLVDVSDEYKIKNETLFLAINYIDRFLSKISISRHDFQLLGTASLFIAAKYEEIYPPEINEFVYITDDSFSKLQILQMEKLILTVLDFDVSTPTSNYFLEKYLSDLELDKEVYCLSTYLCFLSNLECTPFLKYYPSEIAFCCILLASQILNVHDQIPSEFIQKSFSYERSLGKNGDIAQLSNDRNALMEELKKLLAFAPEHQQQAIQRKFSSSKYYKVGQIGPDVFVN